MKTWIVRLLVAAAVVAFAWWLASDLLGADPVRVETVLVERGRVESTITNSKAGTIRARQRAHMSPEVGGRVVAIGHRKGQRVDTGDVIFRLNAEHLEATLAVARHRVDAAQAQSEQAQAAADRARRELARKRTLADDEIVSQDLLDQLESALNGQEAAARAAVAQVAVARSEVVLAEAELAKTVVRAPFGGVIAELEVELGEWITPSPPLLQVPAAVDLIDTTSLYVSAPMDEVDSAAIRAGQRVKITIDSWPDRVLPGEVVRVAPYVLDIEEQNRTVEVEVELDDAEFSSSLLPGTSADVEIVLETREDVVRVPTAALYEGNTVLVVEDGVLVAREVEVGVRNWDWAEIAGGLDEGEPIVSSLGREEVRAGAEVVTDERAGP